MSVQASPRQLVYLTHLWPSGTVRVQVNGSTDRREVETREEALRVARALGGNDAIIFESMGKRK